MIRVISYGGGVQSTALVVLACTGRLQADVALLANVGDDSEDPRTLEYVRTIAVPWAAERGLPIEEVRLTRRDGSQPTLLETVVGENRRGYLIPVRLSGGMPARRNCTYDWKVKPIGKRLVELGASPDDPADVYLGISTDEYHRATNGRDQPFEHRRYPLLDMGISRDGCHQIIVDAGLPVPPKSACWFCPFHKRAYWAELRRDRPDTFEAAAAMEERLNEKLTGQGRDPVWLTDRLVPLRESVAEAQGALFDAGTELGEWGCDEGVCFT